MDTCVQKFVIICRHIKHVLVVYQKIIYIELYQSRKRKISLNNKGIKIVNYYAIKCRLVMSCTDRNDIIANDLQLKYSSA